MPRFAAPFRRHLVRLGPVCALLLAACGGSNGSGAAGAAGSAGSGSGAAAHPRPAVAAVAARAGRPPARPERAGSRAARRRAPPARPRARPARRQPAPAEAAAPRDAPAAVRADAAARRASGAGGSAGSAGGGAAGRAAGGQGGGGGAAPTPSKGCGSTTTVASGRATIDVSGTTREYILTLPANYDAHHPYRLIFAFHGRMYDAASVANGGPPGSGPYYGIQSLAGDSTIFVAPQALDTSWTNASGRDVAYVSAMLARFEAELCIDQSRVFSTGFSMGAIMTIDLACSQASVFRAVAAMSGEIMGTCTDTHPIAYWASHGDADPTIAPSLGQAARDAFVARNHCRTQTTATTPAGCVSYQGCDAGYPVTWCPFSGVHEPPPFAGEGIWGFLSQF